jgi:hypothetical protein
MINLPLHKLDALAVRTSTKELLLYLQICNQNIDGADYAAAPHICVSVRRLLPVEPYVSAPRIFIPEPLDVPASLKPVSSVLRIN